MKHVFFIYVLIIGVWFQTPAQSGMVILSDNSPLYYVRNNNIYSPDTSQLLFFFKGNIFFKGSADDRQNIYLLSSSLNPGETTLQTFYLNSNRDEVYSFQDMQFYAGKNETDDFKVRNRLLYLERKGKWMAFYASYNDSLLAYYPADSLAPAIAIITAHVLIKRFELEKKTGNALATQLQAADQQFSVIKPVWGNVIDNEWIWDGELLRLRWSNDPRFFWTYDGRYLKPYYGTNPNLQYEWDGEIFKPVWRTSRAEEWTFDGRLIKPVYSTDWATQFVLDAGLLKPWSNVHSEREWSIEGEIPIPVMILVISGIARGR